MTRTESLCPCCGESTRPWHRARPGTAGSCYGSRRLLVRNSHGAIAVCRSCGWGVVSPLPDQTVLNLTYQASREETYLADAEARKTMFARELDAVARLLGKTPSSLLDVGCSYGLLLEEARARSIGPVGLELSDDAVTHCLAAGHAVRQGGVECLSSGDRFDVAFMWDVLEHVVDPASVITQVRRHLNPGGILSLVVPDRGSLAAKLLGERWWSVCDLHLHYPTAGGMDYLLRRAGFSVVERTSLPKTAQVSQFVRWLPGSALRRALSRVVRHDTLITIDPRDQLLVRARAV